MPLTTLTPSPLAESARLSLQPTLQIVLYGLVMLAGECRQTALMAQGAFSDSRSAASNLGCALDFQASTLANHMIALGLPVDLRVDGAADNNPLGGSFSSGETDASILGEQLLIRCRTLAMLIRDALAIATTSGSVESVIELEAVALAVSRFGGQLAQALR